MARQLVRVISAKVTKNGVSKSCIDPIACPECGSVLTMSGLSGNTERLGCRCGAIVEKTWEVKNTPIDQVSRSVNVVKYVFRAGSLVKESAESGMEGAGVE